MRSIALILMTISLAGCSLFNPIIGYERSFKWHIDSYVGQTLAAMDNEIKGRVWLVQSIDRIDELYDEHVFLRKWSPINGEVKCLWAAKINKETKVIESWRYISDSSQCDWPYFYEGAW